jgi:hypothetical protein
MRTLLSDYPVRPAGETPLNAYAHKLLRDLGAAPVGQVSQGEHPARLWADSGLMALTAAGSETSGMCPVPLAACADGALNAFRALAATRVFPTTTGAGLLAERAALYGFLKNDSRSPVGHCRLLPSRDGRIGLNLAREEDWHLLPAWLQSTKADDWQRVENLVGDRTTASLVSRGRLLGLAVVDAERIPSEPCHWMDIAHVADAGPSPDNMPRVIDLSALWAGPLCSNLWQAAGAEVIKVESSQRADGARSGSRAFFEQLNRGKESVVLDLHRPSGQQALRDLLSQADIVLEASRPRALRQMGIIAEELVGETPNLSWVSITGYGRREPQANWIAYGDDAGIAAGLSAIMHQVTGEWLICGDAIADPLTGLHAALAGWASWLAGGGHLIALSLEQTVRHCIAATAPADNNYCDRQARWQRYLLNNDILPSPPRSKREVLPSSH